MDRSPEVGTFCLLGGGDHLKRVGVAGGVVGGGKGEGDCMRDEGF